MQKLSFTLLAITLGSTWIRAERKPPAPHSPAQAGTVSGKVFLITRAGDIKPGRMALVIAMPSGAKALDWSLSIQKEIAEMKDAHIRADAPWGDSNTCKEELDAYDHGIFKIVDSSSKQADKRKYVEDTVLISKADEEGDFKLTLPRGSYTIVARGRAGLNDAVWVEDSVRTESGKTLTIKLSSPATSCLDPADDQ